MRMVASVWLAVILHGISASSVAFKWGQLKENLEGPDPKFAAELIAENWTNRPKDFIHGVKLESWKRIAPLLSRSKIEQITREEFEQSEAACKAFARHLPIIPTAEHLPSTFRLAVYQLLFDLYSSKEASNQLETTNSLIKSQIPSQQTGLQVPGSFPTRWTILKNLPAKEDSQEITQLISSIPAEWVKLDGSTVVTTLTRSSPRALKNLNHKAIVALLQNPNNACALITADILNTFNTQQLKLMTPSCMAVIKDLDKADISQTLSSLPYNIFAAYNGPLARPTIQALSAGQLWNFGLFIRGSETICQYLELAFVNKDAFSLITAECLYGYLSNPPKRALGNLWESIPPVTLTQFTAEMRKSWGNIAPTDFLKMNPVTQTILFSSPFSCTKLDITQPLKSLLGNISAPCLKVLFSQQDNPVKLGRNWTCIPISVINEAMIGEDVGWLNKIDVEELFYQSQEVMNIFLRSELILSKFSKLDPLIPPLSSTLPNLTKEVFLKIARVAPSIAGQILLSAKYLKDDILADLNGHLVRSLTCISGQDENLNWKSLFAKLKVTRPRFDPMISHLFNSSKGNFCSTIKDLEDYLSIPWLSGHITDQCIHELKFDLTDDNVALKAPEIFQATLPWRKMLESLDLNGWKGVFAIKKLAIELGENCEFWAAVNNQNQSIIKEMDEAALKAIRPICVKSLGLVLSVNCKIVPHLAEDAFSTHATGELPCALNWLSPKQIHKVSTLTILNPKNPTIKEISILYFSKVTIQEVESLNNDQFKALFISQWRFVPDEIKPIAQSQRLDPAIDLLRSVISNRQINVTKYFEREHFDLKKENARVLSGALDFYLMMGGDSSRNGESLDLNQLFSIIKRSDMLEYFLEVFRQNSSLQPLVISLMVNSDQIRSHLQIWEQNEHSATMIALPFKRESGFDRDAIMYSLFSDPEKFADPGSHVVSDDLVDQGGPMRRLVGQILEDVKRDLIRPGQQVIIKNSATRMVEGVSNFESVWKDFGDLERNTLWNEFGFMDEIPKQIGPIEQSPVSSSNCKFTWGVGREAGFVSGLAFGKAFQLNMRLPFSLDEAFYHVIVDPRDTVIENYYNSAYERDFLEFKNFVFGLRDQASSEVEIILDTLTRHENIRFTKLSTKSGFYDASHDISAKTNIKSCGIEEGFSKLEEVIADGFLEGYFDTLNLIIGTEFKEFIHEFIRGLSYVLPQVRKFKVVPISLLSPIAKNLPLLFNAEPIKGDDLIDNVNFEDDSHVKFLTDKKIKRDKGVKASKVVAAFIRSLNSDQLERLVAIWTGASTFSFKRSNLSVEFDELRNQFPVTIDFCNSNTIISDSDTALVIKPGPEYLELFGRFAQQLVTGDSKIAPECPKGGLPLFPISVSTCELSITVTLQPAQQMFNSLVDLLNMPIAAIWDN